MTADCFCTACGYPLKHALAGKCPECGKAYSAAVVGSTAKLSCEHLRIRRRKRWKAVLKGLVVALAVCVSLYYFLVYLEYLQARYHVQIAGGWKVLEVCGYDEEPGYTVTGVRLAPKDRPDAVVHLALGNRETLGDGEPIRIYSMKALRLDRDDPRLLNDPRLNDQQRYYLKYYDAALDIRDTGPLGHLFPHPIRNLDDLRIHYDEVYAVFSTFAGQEAK